MTLDTPTRCIDPCMKFCQECKYGVIKYPDWVETYEDTIGCSFEASCMYNLENTIPTEEEEAEFENWANKTNNK